jgi:hypothetical protein
VATRARGSARSAGAPVRGGTAEFPAHRQPARAHMGLFGNIKAWVLSALAPLSYHKGAITMPGAVRIVDSLNGMYHRKGPHRDNSFTGDEAFKSFFEPILEALRGSEHMYAAVCDDQAGVPWQKRMTQLERRSDDDSRSRKLAVDHPWYVKYPDACTFESDGLVRPGSVVPERFLMDEIMKNSTLRKKLLDYYCGRMQNPEEIARIAEGKVVRFEYDNSGPWYFHCDGFTQRADMCTNHGEYDITANRIALEYADRPIIFQTTDTDTIPLVVSLLQEPSMVNPVAWVFDGFGYVDCQRMSHDLLRATGFSADTFVLACVLCGTDYYKKTWLAHFFNDEAIFSALKHPHCLRLFADFATQSHDDHAALDNLVAWLHTTRFDARAVAQAKIAKSAKLAENKKRKNAAANADWAAAGTTAAYIDWAAECDERVAAGGSHGPSSSAAALAAGEGPASKKAKLKREAPAPHVFATTVAYLEHRSVPDKAALFASSMGKQYRMPTADDVASASHRTRFNVWYWTQYWKGTAQIRTYEAWRDSLGLGPSPGPESESARTHRIAAPPSASVPAWACKADARACKAEPAET